MLVLPPMAPLILRDIYDMIILKEDVCNSEVLLKVINNELRQQPSLTYNVDGQVFGIFAIVDPLFIYGWTIVAYVY